jgi:hypothetical protein
MAMLSEMGDKGKWGIQITRRDIYSVQHVRWWLPPVLCIGGTTHHFFRLGSGATIRRFVSTM